MSRHKNKSKLHLRQYIEHWHLLPLRRELNINCISTLSSLSFFFKLFKAISIEKQLLYQLVPWISTHAQIHFRSFTHLTSTRQADRHISLSLFCETHNKYRCFRLATFDSLYSISNVSLTQLLHSHNFNSSSILFK